MSRSAALTAALFTAVVLGFAALVALLMPAAPAQAVQERPAAAVQAEAPAAAPDAFLAALVGPGTEVPANAAELLLAADRVCEGLSAGADLLTMQNALSAAPLPGADAPLTDEEARHFVNTAAVLHCTPPTV